MSDRTGPGSGSMSRAERAAPERLLQLLEERDVQVEDLLLWATSPERSWYMGRRRSIYPWIAVTGTALVVAVAVALTAGDSADGRVWAFVVAAVAAVGLLWCSMPFWAARGAFAERRKALARYRVDVALRAVCESEEGGERLPLAGLFELNRRQLDEYQEMTKRQQRLAFRATWGASVVALVILVTGILLSFRMSPGSGQYVVGGLTGLGSLLSAFLGNTFFKGHRDAMDQLNFYYAEPSLTGRLLAAERIAEKLDVRHRDRYAAELVKALTEWRPPSPDGKATADGKTGTAGPTGGPQPAAEDGAKAASPT